MEKNSLWTQNSHSGICNFLEWKLEKIWNTGLFIINILETHCHFPSGTLLLVLGSYSNCGAWESHVEGLNPRATACKACASGAISLASKGQSYEENNYELLCRVSSKN